MVDFGDAPILPADPVRSHRAIEATVAAVLAAGAVPIVLGGDHSIAEPDIRACAAVHGPVGLVHFDAHTDTGREVFGVERSHGTPMYRLVESGHVDPTRYVQIGLRGYWPGEEEFAWQRRHGITSHFMHDVRDRGIRAVVADTLATIGGGPVFVSIDVDVLDPAYAPGTGTPEPGGMTSADLLWATREIGANVDARGRRRGRGPARPRRLARHHGARGRPHRARAADRGRRRPRPHAGGRARAHGRVIAGSAAPATVPAS